jgi:hypothetical protein
MTYTFTYDSVLADLQAIVQENGADTTADCVYAEQLDDGEFHPVCIVGHYFSRNDLVNGRSWDEIEDTNCDTVLSYLQDSSEIVFDYEARALLCRVQQYQDHGNTWGWSLQQAINDVTQDEGVTNVSR